MGFQCQQKSCNLKIFTMVRSLGQRTFSFLLCGFDVGTAVYSCNIESDNSNLLVDVRTILNIL